MLPASLGFGFAALGLGALLRLTASFGGLALTAVALGALGGFLSALAFGFGPKPRLFGAAIRLVLAFRFGIAPSLLGPLSLLAVTSGLLGARVCFALTFCLGITPRLFGPCVRLALACFLVATCLRALLSLTSPLLRLLLLPFALRALAGLVATSTVLLGAQTCLLRACIGFALALGFCEPTCFLSASIRLALPATFRFCALARLALPSTLGLRMFARFAVTAHTICLGALLRFAPPSIGFGSFARFAVASGAFRRGAFSRFAVASSAVCRGAFSRFAVASGAFRRGAFSRFAIASSAVCRGAFSRFAVASGAVCRGAFSRFAVASSAICGLAPTLLLTAPCVRRAPVVVGARPAVGVPMAAVSVRIMASIMGSVVPRTVVMMSMPTLSVGASRSIRDGVAMRMPVGTRAAHVAAALRNDVDVAFQVVGFLVIEDVIVVVVLVLVVRIRNRDVLHLGLGLGVNCARGGCVRTVGRAAAPEERGNQDKSKLRLHENL